MDLAELIKKNEIEINLEDGTTYGDDFSNILEKRSLQKNKINRIGYFLNGKNINYLNGMDTICKDGDILFLLLPAGGG